MECLDLALQAPTGSNSQGWQWVFVDDPEKKKALADIYRHNATPYLDREQADARRRARRPDRRRDEFGEVPQRAPARGAGDVGPVPGGQSRRCGSRVSAGFWGSLLPAVWSFMLALRSRGLGSAWTTLHLVGKGEKLAAEVLGIPFEEYRQGGLFPIAYTKGTEFQRAKRLPAEQFAHWNGW